MNVFIAGHRGMVGSSIWRELSSVEGHTLFGQSRVDLDLLNPLRVREYFGDNKIEAVIDAAAVVGGIYANSKYPYEFLVKNLQIQNSLIDSAVSLSIKNFVFLGSSCIYPKYSAQPISEDQLLTGSLEQSNQWYAIAKIAGVKSCDAVRQQFGFNYYSLMPTNLYGPGDNFDLTTAHVLPAMIRKFHEGKILKSDVTLWGSGSPMREFLHVDDLARAITHLFGEPQIDGLVNVGSGHEVSIKALSKMIADVVGFRGVIHWDDSKPDGTPRKLLDNTRIVSMGWRPRIDLEEGIKSTYSWFEDNYFDLRNVKI